MKAMTENEINNKGRELMKSQIKFGIRIYKKQTIFIKLKESEITEVYSEEISHHNNIPLIPPYTTEMFTNTSDIVLKFKMMGFVELRGILLEITEDCEELLFVIRPTKIVNNTYKTINIYASEIEYILGDTGPVQLSLFLEYQGE